MGMTGHAVRRFADWTLEVEVHPQLTWTARDVGAGGHGLLRARTQVGPLDVSGGIFGFYEAHRGEYLLWRATAGVSYSLPY
jgi:hypothetical protein